MVINLLNVFEYKGNVYKAKSQYVNGGWGFDDVDVLNDLDEYVYDEEVVEIAEQIMYDMDINKDTITF